MSTFFKVLLGVRIEKDRTLARTAITLVMHMDYCTTIVQQYNVVSARGLWSAGLSE
mgnify:CR=1 FL=1